MTKTSPGVAKRPLGSESSPLTPHPSLRTTDLEPILHSPDAERMMFFRVWIWISFVFLEYSHRREKRCSKSAELFPLKGGRSWRKGVGMGGVCLFKRRNRNPRPLPPSRDLTYPGQCQPWGQVPVTLLPPRGPRREPSPASGPPGAFSAAAFVVRCSCGSLSGRAGYRGPERV